MAAQATRASLLVAAAAFAAIGVPSFVAPTWASSEFPWSVGPFLAQTIGGWSLGTAAIALYVAVRALPRRMYPLLIYLGLFGVGQLLVVGVFVARLQTGHLLTSPYLVGLVALVVAGAGGVAVLRSAPAEERATVRRAPWWVRGIALGVGGFVLLLAVGTLLAGPDGATARGEIFPEQMSPFSIKAFSAFLFALAAAILSSVRSTDLAPFRALGWAGLYLIVPITGAALLNLGLFDASRPGSMVYLWAYIVVGVIIVAVLAYERLRPEAFEPA